MSLQDKIKNAKDTYWPLENWKTIDSLTIFAKGLDCLGDTEHAEDIRQAIDTMRKYQKIADLYDYWRSGKCEYTISCMENIGKVLKDGENNN